jgi:hypothetical protein
MRPFEFIFDGTPVEEGKAMNAGIRVLSGEPLEIANCLGMFAAQKLRTGEPQAAIIVINAFKKFMESYPDMTEQMLKLLTFNDGARIVRPSPDQMGNVDPFKSFRGNKN